MAPSRFDTATVEFEIDGDGSGEYETGPAGFDIGVGE